MNRFTPLLLALLLILPACASPVPDDTASTDTAAEQAPAPAAELGAPPWAELEPPALPDRKLNVGFLIIEGVYNTELTAPYDIFQHTIFHTEKFESPHPGMETFTVSPDGGPVTTFEGLVVDAHYSFADAPPIDVLVVPSAKDNMGADLENAELIDWVRRTGEQAMFVMSLCDGAFVLAKAGLLEGVACTTFPGDQDTFAEKFPEHDLRRAVSFVHDGKAMTSAGGAKSFDVAMYLVEYLYGMKAAQGIGGGLIIAWPPTAEQVPAIVVEAAGEGA